MNARLLCVGDLVADITIAAATAIAPGSDTPGHVEISGGGSAANVAAWAARAGLAARFVGVIGDDRVGDFLVDGLAVGGVDVVPIRRVATSSRSIAAIVAGDGERSMVSDLSTATVLTTGDVDAAWLDDVTWLHLTGYTYFPVGGHHVVARLIAFAAERDIPWSIDPSSVRMLAEHPRNDVRAAFAGAAVLFPNRDEAEWLSGETDAPSAAEALLDIADTCVVTCGADGAVVARRNRVTIVIDAAPGPIVNALGAGDAFAAGFITGRAESVGDVECAHRGRNLAALALSLTSSR